MRNVVIKTSERAKQKYKKDGRKVTLRFKRKYSARHSLIIQSFETLEEKYHNKILEITFSFRTNYTDVLCVAMKINLLFHNILGQTDPIAYDILQFVN